MGGGEILRAVLDKSCAFSNPVFYSADLTSPATSNPNGANFGAAFECKQDRYFLMTGFCVGVILAATGYQEQTGAQVSMRIAKSSRAIYGQGNFERKGEHIPTLLVGQDFNRQMTLPDYILYEPNDTILLDLFLPAGVAGPLTYPVTMYGIEYAR